MTAWHRSAAAWVLEIWSKGNLLKKVFTLRGVIPCSFSSIFAPWSNRHLTKENRFRITIDYSNGLLAILAELIIISDWAFSPISTFPISAEKCRALAPQRAWRKTSQGELTDYTSLVNIQLYKIWRGESIDREKDSVDVTLALGSAPVFRRYSTTG